MARKVEGDVVCPDCGQTVGTVKSRRGTVIRRHVDGPLRLQCMSSGALAR